MVSKFYLLHGNVHKEFSIFTRRLYTFDVKVQKIFPSVYSQLVGTKTKKTMDLVCENVCVFVWDG
jgi:hypothetical protein